MSECALFRNGCMAPLHTVRDTAEAYALAGVRAPRHCKACGGGYIGLEWGDFARHAAKVFKTRAGTAREIALISLGNLDAPL